MFGYVKPEAAELKVKEYNTYKALYCGLCKCTGKCVSCSARFALSYDFVFLALLRLSLTGERPSFDTGRCMAHPLKKRAYAKSCEALSYSAKVGTLLTYYKLEDDIADTRSLKGLGYRMVRPFAKRVKSKARGLDDLEERMREHLAQLGKIEAEAKGSADAPAEVFGALLADVGSYGLEGERARIADEVCRRVGKWIYFADALDDYHADVKSGAYNPLVIAYPEDPEGAKETMLCAMGNERIRALSALHLITCADPGVSALLEKILTYGMAAMEMRLSETEKRKGP